MAISNGIPKQGVIPEEYDFIVAGGGTAGLVVAGRLAENPDVKILVIEAGQGNPEEIEGIMTPSSAMSLRGGKHDWTYKHTMINATDYERLEMKNTRGKVLGGSSSLNYFTWLPCSGAIYDEWAQYGGEGWLYKNVKEYFKKPVTFIDENNQFSKTTAKSLGNSGPLKIAPAELVEELSPFREALKTAWLSTGNKMSEDIYSGEINGLVATTNTIYHGTRSNSVLFVRGKPNITILPSTINRKVIIENGVAVGILTESTLTGEIKIYKAKKEVIVSSGVFESPKLLMLSGVGPAKSLAAHDIELKVDSPHVGQNLIDHPIMPHVFKLKDGYGADHILLHPGAPQTAAYSQYSKTKTGPKASGLLELAGFPRIDSRLEKLPEWQAEKARTGTDVYGPQGQPHFEIDFVPMFGSAFQWHFPTPPSGDYFTVIVDLLRPLSRGQVKLNSADPKDAPSINLGFFGNELDLKVLMEGTRWVDDVLMKGEGMKDIIEGEYPWKLERESDEELRHAVLERASTGFHPCGTARLGKDINEGVVDSHLRVYGVQKLRVIDASIMPVIPDGRIQAPVYMLAEKGADMIKAAYPALY